MPVFSENRKNFAPWEKLPEGNGITYLAKFKHDPGIDPIYLAKIKYQDEAALQKVIDTFGLVLHETGDPPSSFVDVLKDKPSWFPLQHVTKIYACPQSEHDYVANVWIDADERTLIIERSWW